MKKAIILAMSFAFVLATDAQTIKEIITKHIESIGDLKKLKNIKSYKTVYTTDSELMKSASGVFVAGMGSRTETNSLFGKTLNITNKKQGWSVYWMSEDSKPTVEAMSSADHSLSFPSYGFDIQKLLDSYDLINFAQYGYENRFMAFELMGKEMVSGKECYKLKLTYDREVSYWYIDTENGNCLRKTVKGDNGEWVDAYYAQFKKNSDGLVFPYERKVVDNGKTLMTATYSEIETNFKGDKSLFTYKEGN